MSSTSTDRQEFHFQAEIQSLLQILSHSLYQNRAIAIRELVSNASDALDKMRHLRLTDDGVSGDGELAIELKPDSEAKTLTIRDNGIGMSRDDLIENLGTIAHSGSLAFLKRLTESQAEGKKPDVSLIGQFGVGFYAAFMLADRVEVVTSPVGADEAWRWESDGSGQFTIEPTERDGRGTDVILHLKEDLVEEFTREQVLKNTIRRYSTFVPHPVRLGDDQLNDQKPIWVEPKSQVSDEEYTAFYRYLSHGVEEDPLWHLHVQSDSPLNFAAVLYCPPSNFENLGFGRDERGLHLCAKRILVQDDCTSLLPEYLRFIRGLVDSDQLSLNVSRETLQDETIFAKLKSVLTKRVLKRLGQLADKETETYRTFYEQFGPILREGIHNDFQNRDELSKLLRFRSTHSDAENAEDGVGTALAGYVERMPEDQEQIFFLTGPTLDVIRKNPNLELFKKRGLEVLLLDDPVDEFVISQLGEFDGKKLVSISSADAKIPEAKPSDDGDDEDSKTDAEPPTGFSTLLTLFKDGLGDLVEDVTESKRLADSPVCLVTPEGAMSIQLQKVFQMNNQEFPVTKRILEVNPQSDLIKRLSSLTANSSHVDFLKECGRQLFSDAQLREGLLPEGADTADRSERFMLELAGTRSPIIT